MYRYNPLHQRRKDALFNRLYRGLPEFDEDDIGILLNHFEEIDPTSQGKYVTWLVREYLRGAITLPEDAFLLNQTLVKFHQFKHRLENRDIFHYTKGKLAITVGKFEIQEETHAETKLREKLEGRKVLFTMQTDLSHYGNPLYRLVHLTTAHAAREAAKETAWCISSLEVGQDYIDTGMLLLIEEFNRDNLIIEADIGQHWDPAQGEFRDRGLIHRKGEGEWNSLILAHVGYETRRSDPEGDSFQIPVVQMMDVEDESVKRGASYTFYFDALSHLLHLGYKPFLENKIRTFGSSSDKRYWEKYGGNDYMESDGDRCTRLLLYAQTILQKRDPWIESELLQCDDYGRILIEYANTIIRGPWLEAEPIIAQNGDLRSDYLMNHWDNDMDKLTIMATRLVDLKQASQ